MINGSLFRDAVISAANNVANHRQAIDELNVFPVPDGDTGTNMSATMASAGRELALMSDDSTVTQVASKTSSAMLRGARGNSGVILSLIFRGIAKGVKGMDTIETRDLIVALSYGVESAYKAVMKPTEGTILTVVRLAARAGAQYASEHKEADLAEVWEQVCIGADEALQTTPELLPVLKKAGVIDAGGKGLLYAFEGMLSVFKDGKIILDETAEPSKTDKASSKKGKYQYMVSFKIQKNAGADSTGLIALMESSGKDVAVHEKKTKLSAFSLTNDPGKIISEGTKLGSMIEINVVNIWAEPEKAQNIVKMESEETESKSSEGFVPAEPVNEVGFVAVAAGEGLAEMFKEIGVDIVVSGGQTMNPSTEDILNAVEATPAKTVFVLPNNKNIIMAAEQAEPLASRKVIVLPTKTVPQGISAMLNFDLDAQIEDNHLAMTKAIDSVGTAQVTFAARDSQMDGLQIKEGQILGMANGAIKAVEDDVITAAFKVTKLLCTKRTEMITIFYGEGTNEEEAKKLSSMISEKFSSVDVSVINGGQPVYHFIISVE